MRTKLVKRRRQPYAGGPRQPKPLPTRRNKRKRDSSPPSLRITADVFLSFAKHLSPIDPDGSNVVFSPLSLRALLSLVTAGASAPAAEQLLSFLKSDSIDNLNALSSEIFSEVFDDTGEAGGPVVSFANGIWIHDGFSLKQSFKQVVDNVYKADIHQSDFTTAKRGEIESEVNSWANEKTNGLISNIIAPGSVSKTDRLILTNALYFKGAWPKDFFDPSDTKDHEFHLLDGNSVKVPFMTNGRSRLSIGVFDGFKGLCLSYKQAYADIRFRMYILLPDSVDGLAALAERVGLEPDFLDRHLTDLSLKSTRVGEFRIPKFKVSFGFRAVETLKRLGITLPFEVGSLSEMVDMDPAKEGQDQDRLFLDEIYQKAFIEVNEQGTTAAVVSAGLFSGCARLPPKKVDFVADHPFMFLIREDYSGAVLFLGHVLNPLKD